MREMIEGIAAEAERRGAGDFETRGKATGAPADELPVHAFPGRRVQASQHPRSVDKLRLGSVAQEAAGVGDPAYPEPYRWWTTEDTPEERERRIYRGRTVAMLRRYMRYSIETGRMPSLLGREFFRSKVTSYTVVTFEDRVIFVHDMERCLGRLDEFSRELIARHILQEHDQAETAKLLHCGERTVRTYVPMVLDLLSDILLEVGLLETFESNREYSCQGGQNGRIPVSACEEGTNKL